MATSNNASFIPKSPRPGAGRSRIVKRIYVLSYVSYVLFFSALLVVVAVYVYSSIIDNQVAASQAALTEQRQRFSQEQLSEIRELEKQMLLAEDILDRSISPSKLFNELEEVVSDRVAFTGANFKREQNLDSFTYEFSGISNNFNDIIYQRDILNRSQLLAEADLSTYDYSLESENDDNSSNNEPSISFTFTDTVSGSAIAYEPPVMEQPAANSTEVVGEPRGDSEDDGGGTEAVEENI